MRYVQLLTSDGRFVTCGTIPAFDVPPDVILWGDRHFQYAGTGAGDEDGTYHIDQYRECFAVALIDDLESSQPPSEEAN